MPPQMERGYTNMSLTSNDLLQQKKLNLHEGNMPQLHVTSSGENLTYGGIKIPGSDQTSLVLHGILSEPGVFVLYERNCQKHFARFLQSLITIYEYKYMENADLGRHCLLVHKPGFPG